MPKVSHNFGGRRFDANKAKRDLERKLKDIFIDAGKAFAQTLVDEVPTWSGESQGSIEPVAKAFDVPVFTTPVAGAPSRGSAGRAQGHVDISMGPKDYSFVWSSDVFQYGINERYDVSHAIPLKKPGPYNSFPKAVAAFQEVVDEGFAALTFDINDYVR